MYSILFERKNMEKVYLIRHGEDDRTVRGGWSNNKLTKKGIIQSKKLAIYLKEYCKIEKIISSDLERAKQTASIINSLLNVDIEYTHKLREMNNGLLAGMKNELAEKKFPRVILQYFKDERKISRRRKPDRILQ